MEKAQKIMFWDVFMKNRRIYLFQWNYFNILSKTYKIPDKSVSEPIFYLHLMRQYFALNLLASEESQIPLQGDAQVCTVGQDRQKVAKNQYFMK